jgi:hypothetical protein
MKLRNKHNGETISSNDEDWTYDYDEHKDITTIQLGDFILAQLVGDADEGVCQEVVDDNWEEIADDFREVLDDAVNWYRHKDINAYRDGMSVYVIIDNEDETHIRVEKDELIYRAEAFNDLLDEGLI